jgi:predicted GNAT family acetyltransferase
VIRCVEAAPGGQLIGYASAFPDEDFGGRWDIGVLTHPDHRRKGLGVRSVQRLVVDLVADGQLPLYRHNLDNAGSAALAESLGFVLATRLLAVRYPESD